MVFFSQDLLHGTKRNSPLAIVWLAATLGSKQSSFKKLTKKEIAGVNIPYVCKYLQDDREDFALRLSSNLMVGIARVYGLQTDLLYTDINHVLINFKKALFSLQQAPLDLGVTEAREEAITIPLKAMDKIIDLNDEFVFKIPFSREQLSSARYESDETSQTLSLAMPGRDTTIMTTSSNTSPFSIAVEHLEIPSSSIMGGSTKSSFEKSAVELSDPLLQKSIHLPRDRSRLTSEEDFLLGNDEPLDLFVGDHGFHDDYGDFDLGPGIHSSNADEKEGSINDRQLGITSDAMSPKQAMAKSEGSIISLQEKTPAKTPKRIIKRKRKYHLIDEQISLTDSELHQMRLNANLSLKDFELNSFKEHRRKKVALQLSKIPDFDLNQFPKSMHDFLKSHLKEYDLLMFSKKKRGKRFEEEDEESERARGMSLKERMMKNFGHDEDYGELRPEQELIEEQDLSLEIGRAADALDMPWHIPRSETGTASSAQGSRRGARKTLTSTPIRSGISAESPLQFDFEANQGPSSASNEPAGFDIGAFDESSFEKIMIEGSERVQEGEITDAETKAFYNYISTLAEETGSTSIFLLDICIDQPRKTAAAAFYNVLRCAHEGHVKVRQVQDDVEIIIYA